MLKPMNYQKKILVSQWDLLGDALKEEVEETTTDDSEK